MACTDAITEISAATRSGSHRVCLRRGRPPVNARRDQGFAKTTPRGTPAQAIVEFGIIALLFVLLVFGLFDFGMAMNVWLATGNGAREAARQGALGATPDQMRALVQALPFPGVNRSAGPIQVNIYVRTTCAVGCKITGTEHWEPITGTTTWSSATYPTAKYSDGTSIPNLGDQVKILVTAQYYEIVTPLVRPFFGCAGSVAHCYHPIDSMTIVRYEGLHV